jgi:hypothetical protein
MDKFIELTLVGNSTILVSGVMIQTIMRKDNETWVRMMGGNVLSVIETPDQIIKKLKQAQGYTIYNYKTNSYEED